MRCVAKPSDFLISEPANRAVEPVETESNPFATRFVRAGAIPFRFVGGDSVIRLRHRLESNHWRGQIVGPHGAGKTSLLRLLDGHWKAWGREPYRCVLQDGQHRIADFRRCTWSRNQQIIIDGFEQLRPITKAWVIGRCWQKHVGLLVTSHRWVPLLPVTYQCRTSYELAYELVEFLTQGHPSPLRETIRRCCDACDMNMRESFMTLYDEHAAARTQPMSR